MGFIPLFLSMGGAFLLFFLTVRISMQRKVNLQKELLFKLNSILPELVLAAGEQTDPETLISILKKSKVEKVEKKVLKRAFEILKAMKINRIQYNALIKKAPYNWVAKISGFQPM